MVFPEPAPAALVQALCISQLHVEGGQFAGRRRRRRTR